MIWESVTRLEVINESGRILSRWGIEVEPSVQDQGRTLKLFIRRKFESRSPDGDGRGMTGPTSAVDSTHSGELPIPSDQAKSSGDTPAAKAERNSPKAGAGSEPADSHTKSVASESPFDPHNNRVSFTNAGYAAGDPADAPPTRAEDYTAEEALQVVGGSDGCGPGSLRELVHAFHERGALLSRLSANGPAGGDSPGQSSRTTGVRDPGSMGGVPVAHASASLAAPADAPPTPQFVDPSSDAGQRIIRNSAYEQPVTQGDPPPDTCGCVFCSACFKRLQAIANLAAETRIFRLTADTDTLRAKWLQADTDRSRAEKRAADAEQRVVALQLKLEAQAETERALIGSANSWCDRAEKAEARVDALQLENEKLREDANSAWVAEHTKARNNMRAFLSATARADALAAHLDELRQRLEKLGGVAKCVKLQNTPEFMEYLTEQIAAAEYDLSRVDNLGSDRSTGSPASSNEVK